MIYLPTFFRVDKHIYAIGQLIAKPGNKTAPVPWPDPYKSTNYATIVSDNGLSTVWWLFNSLAPGGFENIFQNVFFKLISWIDTLSNSCETALRSMPQNPSDDKSTLVQVMAWCRQAASHYLSQCCPRSLSPYGVTRPQWVKPMLAQW